MSTLGLSASEHLTEPGFEGPAHLYSSLEATAVDSTAIETPSTIPLHPYPLTANTQLPSPSLQPNYPGAHTSTPSPPPSAALSPAFAPGFGRSPRRAHDNPPVSLLQSPFRTRGAVATSTSPLNRQYAHFHSPHRQLLLSLESDKLDSETPTYSYSYCNNSEETPVIASAARIPLTLPSPHLDFDPSYPTAAGAGDQPLLSAPKNQQQTRHSVISARASLQSTVVRNTPLCRGPFDIRLKGNELV
ncbi:hypothetical protein B0T09DRAFT_400381 [Sordaria sp. MPI-SDFR-AT-0083]|nr:hypothetical protein B0T09DRAFT_400381 [Sordaria sp. MPI-SDFR-AT-0083]